MRDYVNLFSGAGGWEVGAHELGLIGVGIEFDKWAHATALAAGHESILGDVREFGPATLPSRGLIASPPCQTFSTAGKGAGRAALEDVLNALACVAECVDLPDFEDERTALVTEPLRWAVEAFDQGRPYEWIALEQVPTVLPVWEEMALHLRSMGYGTAVSVLHAEQYGVPQTRKRAILIARLDGEAEMPTPTHSRYHNRSPERVDEGLEKWVSMAEVLGRGGAVMRSNYGTGGDPAKRGERTTEQPAPTITSKAGRNRWLDRVNNQSGTEFDLDWQIAQPATVVAGRDLVPFRGANANRFNGATKSRNDGIYVTIEEAAALQTFPEEHPFQGNKGQRFMQVGNAVPPLLAKAVLESATRNQEEES